MSEQTLPEFLLARIAEDEAVAKAASPGCWSYPGIESVAGGTLYDETRRIADIVYEQPEDHDGTIVRHLLVPEADANGRHIARHDPARVLAECEAKRRIMETHRHAGDWGKMPDAYACPNMPRSFEESATFREAEPCDTLRALAIPYADHPDYREEWKP